MAQLGQMPSLAAQRPCPVCNSLEARAWLVKGPMRLVCCAACDMVYASPVPPELASGAFYARLAVPYYLTPEKLAGDYAPARFVRELRLFHRFCPQGAVLDVGCSTGAFLFQLKSRWPDAYTVLGTDVAEAALDYAESRGVSVWRGSFLEADFGTERFAAVTFWAVMEHLAEPARFLRKAATLLPPGGHCFVLVPNLHSLAARLLGGRYRYILPEHVNYFTPATLRKFAAREPALEVIALRSMHFNPLVIWQDLWHRRDQVPEAERACLLQRTTAWKQSSWLTPLQFGYAAVERMLGWLRLADNLVVVLRRTRARL